ncbi:peptidase M24 family protein [Sporosarcina sp. P20a]|uniref:M24 family metallopeptidase n=1 Tax=Sporosarcina sp. P20a TaxID=2048256 RepID=UPI000C17091E|nr:Xaa-Pro peptidase family protein [Sporosarcina sp. P20a]PIC87406.1 peptidase M24 family protein [Sporosarcina sp. P20a]
MTNIQKVQDFLEKHNIDAALITNPDNIFYLTDFRSDPHERLLAVVVFKEADPFIICPAMEVADVKAIGWQYDAIGYKDTDNAFEFLDQAITERISTCSLLAIEKEHLTVDRFEILQERFPALQFAKLDDELANNRLIKNDVELQHLRKAAELADYAIEVGCNEIAEGKTELEIVQAVEQAVKQKGAEKMSFDTIIVSGTKTASPHGIPGDKRIEKGDFILFDLGVVYKGYCSDITRTIAFGEPTEEKRKIYETVKKAQQAAIDVVRPGTLAREVDHAARSIIEEAGYGKLFPHRIGHGLGISVHEFPSLTGTNDMPLQEGMVFTIEPGIYDPAITGVRIEDDLYVTKDGVEVLTKFPKDLKIVGE